ncbi:hypothetical protein AGRA3207_003884 [Actinomadura graeca]|uniref:Uncharacterized protein n=1 Tax=Actinomadura graeca TaxID=2750812 RepID=A0ABX8QYP3_9ACTN|nr:hypothetical protein [Actinomadura graeca]QXJ22822.1 hypothetical protein AGRA3207_003884 [Actinomadura graeca]
MNSEYRPVPAGFTDVRATVILVTACLAGAIAGISSYLYVRSPAQALRDAVTALCGVLGLLNQVAGTGPARAGHDGGGPGSDGAEEEGA